MIVAVCLNPASDVTYGVADLDPHSSHRVLSVQRRAGGKGVNVARVLHQLGIPSMVIGLAPAGGERSIAADLAGDGIDGRFADVAGVLRQSVAVVDPGGATVFNEPGPVVTPAEWADFLELFDLSVIGADVVVLSGSVPRSLGADAYATLVRRAHAAGARTVIDAEGPVLEQALPVGPSVAKPNRDEAAGFLGRPVTGVEDAHEAARRVIAAGAGAAIISLGEQGMVARTGDRGYTVTVPEILSGNPTGAGDALAAVVALGLANNEPWPQLLRNGAAVSAAAVVMPLAGEFDPTTADHLRPQIRIEES
ncbi:1-phosphofructokinase [Nakamurella silvestris]|nr:1-phosphofructokinase [Nakamurella silvestris]